MKILGLIPARVGSVGLKKKNILLLDNVPLIAHTISTAKKSSILDKIVVSTDSQDIANVAKNYGAEVPFLRPKKFSTSKSSNLDVIKHALRSLKKIDYCPDIIVYLQPTSPFRTKDLIDKSIKLLKSSKSTCIISVSKIKQHPYAAFWYKKNQLIPFVKNFEKFIARQKRPTLYYPTGAVFTFWTDNIQKFDSYYGDKISPLIVNDPVINMDIDDTFDFFICEMIKKYWDSYNLNS